MGSNRAVSEVSRFGLSVLILLTLTLGFAVTAHAAVGRTSGSFSVSSSGSANYSIPIWTPPGPQGLQPHIALTYDSRRGTGYVGVGWGLSGLSSIYRCNATFAQNATPAPVSLSAADVFCLDGQQLRLVTGAYGAAGSTYQTEVANFETITAYGSAGAGPAYFVVKDRNGVTYQYGNGGSSEVLANGSATALSWYVSEATDPAGNTMTYAYSTQNSTGAVVPSLISWTPASHGSSNYNYTMAFVYGSNAPQSSPSGYVAGTPVTDTNLLSSITINYQGAAVKKYALTYQQSPTTAREELTQIQECADSALSNCLSPTTVTYQNGTAGVSTTTSTVSSSSSGWFLANYDLNGDGYMDLLYQNPSSGTWSIAFGSASGYGTPVSTGITTVGYVDGQGTFLVGDLLGTGKAGILVNNGGTWYYYTWNGSSFSGASTGIPYDTAASSFGLADTNGDGLPDLVSLELNPGGVSEAAVYIRLNTGASGTLGFGAANLAYTNTEADLTLTGGRLITLDSMHGSSLKALDFNGDGRQDLVLHMTWRDVPDRVNLLMNFELLAQGTTFTQSSFPTGTSLQFVDWNNDGCTDYTSGSQLIISACNGNPGVTLNLGYTPLAVMDWDGDGRMDLLYASGGNMYVQLSTGVGLATATQTTVAYNSAAVYVGYDFTGDGLDDLLAWNGTTLTYNLHNSSGQPPDLLSKITDGYGNWASPTYVSMTQSDYSPAFNQYSQAPIQSYRYFTGPLYVVNQATFSDPSSTTGATYQQSFSYYDAWMSLQGRGFMGFATQQRHDSRNGVWDTFGYCVEFPCPALPFYDLTSNDQAGNQQIRYAFNNLVVATLDGTTYNERYFPYFSNMTVQTNEVGGPKNSQLISTVSTNYAFDTYGNPTNIATTVTDKDSGSPYYGDSWTTTVVNTPDPDATHWCLGLVTQTQVTYTASIGASVTRTKQFSPDTTNCRYTQIVTEPNNAQYSVTETLGYDPAAGTLLTDTVTGAGMASRTTTIVWDAEGLFPTSITDPANALIKLGYDYSMGLLTSTTDANNLTTSWQYGDGFGRKTRENRPDGTYTVWQYYDMSGSGYGFHGLLPAEFTYSSSGALVHAHDTGYDSADRVFVQLDQNISGGYSQYNIKYDSLGRVAQRSSPCAWVSWPTTCTYWTTNSYDVLNRLTSVSRPISASDSGSQSTNYTYEGRTTLVNDALQHSRTLVNDVNGWLRQTIDAYGYAVTTAYDAAGSKASVTDSQGSTLWGSASYAYGIAPFLLGATDSDRGAWTYAYDALGEMTSWKDAKGQQFSATYDALSRPVTRSEPDLFTQWTWGSTPSAYNVGKLQSVCTGTGTNPTICTSATGYAESETYDTLGRIYQQVIQIPTIASPNNGSYTYTYQYNAATGLPDTLSYPVSTNSCQLVVKYGYSYGILGSLTDASNSTQCGSTGTVFWAANATDSMGHVTQATLGDGVVVNRAYDAVTGLVQSIQATNSSGTVVQNQSYLFDKVGDLTQRQDNSLGLTENFYYDNVYRLDHSTLGGKPNLQMGYGVSGNITSKSDVSTATWTYDTNHVHRLLTAGSNSYTYDNNGNAVTRNGSAVTWASYNYPSNIQSGSYAGTFYYGPDRQRFFQVVSDSSNTEQTTFVGPALELTFAAGGATMWRHYIYAGKEPVAIVYRESNGTNFSGYLLKDHLGGVASVLQGATPRVNESFAPFGLERSAADWSSALSSGDAANVRYLGRRGFDFQTVIGQPGSTNALGLIHMNGRVEDVVTGRFLSADPNIPNPSDPQSYNRYAYVNNNPLTYIDPSGFCGYEPETNEVVVCGGRPGGRGGLQIYGGSYGSDPDSRWNDNRSEPKEHPPEAPCTDASCTQIVPGHPSKPQAPSPLVPLPQAPVQPSPVLCKALSTAAGAVSGAVGGVTFSLATGNVTPVGLATGALAGAVIGGAAAFVSTDAGFMGAVGAGIGSLAVHTAGGTSAKGFSEVLGDTVGGYAAPAYAVPVGAGFGAVTGALEVGALSTVGTVGGAFFGAHAGALSAAAALSVNSALSALITHFTGCL